ncbi:winged helix-turn-helix domain-containing protein [Glaciimonas sp. GG7]
MSKFSLPSIHIETNSKLNVSLKRQFVVGDFILSDTILFYKGEEVPLPPKERAVLIVLLEVAGGIVSKNTLLERVWPGEFASEESLTRCIYVLRRILKESNHERYIVSVYGQGYRFAQPVSVIYDRTMEPVGCKLAVLPFRLGDSDQDASAAHDSIVQSLSNFRPFGLTVFPSSLTRSCHAAAEVVALIKDMAPDYYLTGYPVISGGCSVLRVELVRAIDHAVLHRENVALSQGGWVISLQHKLSALLPRCIPGLMWGSGVPQQTSLNVTLAYLNGKRDLRCFTPQSLKRALSQFHECLSLDPLHVPSWCALAEIYLTLAFVGLVDQDLALNEIEAAVDKALNFEPSNPLALALRSRCNSFQSDDRTADILLQQALLLAPQTPEVHYYHALHLFSIGDLYGALEASNICLAIDPSATRTIILNSWLMFCCGDVDSGIAQADQHHALHAPTNAILRNLIVAMQVAKEQSSEYVIQSEYRHNARSWKSGSIQLNCLSSILSTPIPTLKVLKQNASDIFATSSLLTRCVTS